MQQFQVPQFIDVEDKIFGPLTTKQFFYLVGSGGLCFLYWFFLKPWIAFPLIIPTAGLGVALAFLKINGRPFLYTVANFFVYLSSPRRFLWQRTQKKIQHAEDLVKKSQMTIPKLTENRLNDLAWSLDINEKVKR